MRVFFHSRTKGKVDWINEIIEVEQVPAVGEYFNIHDDEEGESITRVQCVIHTPRGISCDAEAFGVWEKEYEVLSKAFKDDMGDAKISPDDIPKSED